MAICFNCGTGLRDEAIMCHKCGETIVPDAPPENAPQYVQVGPQKSIEDFAQAPNKGLEMAVPPPAGEKKPSGPVGMGYSSASLVTASTKGDSSNKEKKEQERKARKARKPFLAGVAPGDESIEESEEAKAELTARIRKDEKNSRRVLLIATMLLVPALAMPWFYFLDSRPVEAFRLPLALVLLDSTALPWLSVGIAISVFFFVGFILSIIERPVITVVQVMGLLSIVIALGVILLGVRQWNAMAGLGPGYTENAYRQFTELPDTRVFGLVEHAPPDSTEVQNYSGRGSGSIFSFLLRVLGPGVLFPLFSGAIVLWSGLRYGRYYSSSGINLPPALVIVGILALMFGGILFAVSRIAPAMWYSTRAAVYMQLNRNDKAAQILLKCTKLPVPTGTCETTLAGIYWQEDQKKPAKDIIRKVTKEKPGFPDGHRMAGDMAFAEKNYDQAAASYKTYLELSPGYSVYVKKLFDSIVFIGTEEYGEHKYKAALGHFLEALDIYTSAKTDTTLLYKIADCYNQTGDVENAIVYFRTTADLMPHDFELQINVGKLYEKIKDYENAMKYYEKSIEARPDNSLSYVYIGNIYRDVRSDKAKAAEWYKKGIEVNDSSNGADVARKNLSEL